MHCLHGKFCFTKIIYINNPWSVEISDHSSVRLLVQVCAPKPGYKRFFLTIFFSSWTQTHAIHSFLATGDEAGSLRIADPIENRQIFNKIFHFFPIHFQPDTKKLSTMRANYVILLYMYIKANQQ